MCGSVQYQVFLSHFCQCKRHHTFTFPSHFLIFFIIGSQIKEKEEAKAEYEEAKSEGKSASLLQQRRPNVFTMDVANIMPGDTARIELHYTELINIGFGDDAVDIRDDLRGF